MGLMIQVDISNIWGEVALPELLAVEKDIIAAHMELTEHVPGWMALPVDRATEEMLRIQEAAQKIRSSSDVFVVVGTHGGCLGAKAAIRLLQGENRNLGKGKGDPVILFAGDNFSSHAWQRLQKQLEGKDFSVAIVSKSGQTPACALASRALRWMLERKYGSEKARRRIFALTHPEEGALRQMAREAGWETFDIPASVDGHYGVLTAAGLLPMAVAGLDIKEIMIGAWEASVEYDLRSFENPVWLYAGVRNLLHRKGKDIELLGCFEPDFAVFGTWWQQLFGESEGKDGKGLFPVYGSLPEALLGLGQTVLQGKRNLFETMVRFAPPQHKVQVTADVKNLDGFGGLEGKTLDHAEEEAWFAALETHTDCGVPVVSLDAGELCCRTLGQLIWFFQLSGAVSAGTLGVEHREKPGVEILRENLRRRLGEPGC